MRLHETASVAYKVKHCVLEIKLSILNFRKQQKFHCVASPSAWVWGGLQWWWSSRLAGCSRWRSGPPCGRCACGTGRRAACRDTFAPARSRQPAGCAGWLFRWRTYFLAVWDIHMRDVSEHERWLQSGGDCHSLPSSCWAREEEDKHRLGSYKWRQSAAVSCNKRAQNPLLISVSLNVQLRPLAH